MQPLGPLWLRVQARHLWAGSPGGDDCGAGKGVRKGGGRSSNSQGSLTS